MLNEKLQSISVSCNAEGSESNRVVSRLESTKVDSSGEDEHEEHEEHDESSSKSTQELN